MYEFGFLVSEDSSGGGFFSNVAQGFAFGAGSAVAHKQVFERVILE